jgi:hypothetical protein
LDELGTAYFSSGDFANAGLTWHKALLKAMAHGGADTAVRALSRLAFPTSWDNPTRLRSASEVVLEHVSKIEDPVKRAEVTMRALALCDIAGSSRPDHFTLAENALKQIVDAGDPTRIASARISSAALRLAHAEYHGVIADLEESLPVALEHDSADVLRAEWWLSWALLHAGQWGRCQSVAKTAAEHADKNGNPRMEALFTTQLAWLHVESGAYDSAQSLCKRASELSGNRSRGVGSTMCTAVNAMAAIGLRDADGALLHAERTLSASPRAADFWQSLAETSALQAHIMKNDLSKAARSTDHLLALLANMPEKTWKAIGLSACAAAAAANNQREFAHQCIDSALQLVSGSDLPLAKWRVEAVAAEILGGEFSQDAGRFRTQSRNARMKLFDSLSTQDPLRPLAGQSADAQT